MPEFRNGNASPAAMNGNEQPFAALLVVINAQDHFKHDVDG